MTRRRLGWRSFWLVVSIDPVSSSMKLPARTVQRCRGTGSESDREDGRRETEVGEDGGCDCCEWRECYTMKRERRWNDRSAKNGDNWVESGGAEGSIIVIPARTQWILQLLVSRCTLLRASTTTIRNRNQPRINLFAPCSLYRSAYWQLSTTLTTSTTTTKTGTKTTKTTTTMTAAYRHITAR